MARTGPLCLRLPDDLHAAVHTMAEQQGVTPSEWCRDLIHRTIYGEPLGIDEGYLHGRALGYKAAVVSIGQLQMPETADEAMRLLQAAVSPGRTPHERG